MVQQTDLSIPGQNSVGVRAWRSVKYYFSTSNALLAPPTRIIVDTDKSVLENHLYWFPVSLVGPTHTGKSTWISGVYWTWVKNHTRQKSLLVSALDFHREFRNALLTKTMAEFDDRFRSLRFLAISDIQHLLQYPESQQELVHLIDILSEKQAPILFSINEDEEADGWNPKLIKRLQSGLLVKTQPPDEQLRRAITVELLENLHFPEEDIPFIADWVVAKEHLSVTEIKGELARLDLGYRQTFAEPEILRDGFTVSLLNQWSEQSDRESAPLKIHDIAKVTVKEFGITLADLRSTSRRKTNVLTRAAVVYLGRKLGNFTLEQIADYLGGRDHTTISHAVKMFNKKLESDAELRKIIMKLERVLR